ncbi:hypothetical protein [Paenibacillus sp. QZ-Y1]|uniref:hypothetical protein n=1 Tax=Paenibacillus sp. QZ-Y1 TaxID=3414511 RepID=UPI003F78C8B0
MIKGTVILTKHLASGNSCNYLVVDTKPHHKIFGLVNLESFNLMKDFSTKSEKEIYEYIESILKCEIVEVQKPIEKFK